MRRLWIIALLIVALVAVGCGKTEPTATPASEEPKASEPTATPKSDEPAAPSGQTGQIQLAGSTTVQPLAEVLAEAYMAQNPDLVIEVQGGGSSVGVTSAGEGTVDIGMASRNVKDSEKETFPNMQVHTIARDGIAIATHPDTELPTLSVEQVRDIFAGDITNYSEVGGPDAAIIVVSREEGSGTRAAFEELVMEHGEEKVITDKALLQQSNGQVRTTVATTPNAIGYLSFGFLDDSTNPVPIDGVEPSVENVQSGEYPISRPLNFLTDGDPNELSQAFIDFILSGEGQDIVAEDYIPVAGRTVEAPAPTPTPEVAAGLSGQIQLAGSTTVQPLAEVLAEAYMAQNPDLVIEVQGGGSSVGVTSAGEGTVDIGNASRNVKDSEFETFPNLQVFTVARDGIAIATHPDTELPTLSVEQVRDIFAGEITNYSEVGGPDAAIIVVSREEGSGTRAAFEELVMEHGEEKVITDKALLQQSNGQVRTTVSTTPNAIGYLSFGFLDDSTNPVPIDGVEPTVENVQAGQYPISRPLNMLTNGAPNELSQAFLDFIFSQAGQDLVAEDYIAVPVKDKATPESREAPAAGLSGQIQLAGSTTVQPLAEKLAEAYMAQNPDLVIEVQGGGSSVGVTSAGEGTVDIGMASRNVKDSEKETFPNLQVHTIAGDGIAIATHPDTELPSLSVEQVRDIFSGDITNYSEVDGPDAAIIVVSREEGSGTRAAFEELVMEHGEEKAIFERALLQQSNGQVRTTVSTTPNAIGYLGFAFLDDSTRPVSIDGVEPSVANVLAGEYPIARPLNMLTNGDPNELAQAFLDFILSDEGQAIVAEDNIPVQ
jgi:phosphate transport system substrate-binding protein